jgi:hypothetical protein
VRDEKKKNSIYEVIGWSGLFNVVWNSSPRFIRWFTLPYGLRVYGSFLRGSTDLRQLLGIHTRQYMSSRMFRLFRPRFHKVEYFLRNYGINN